MPDSKQYDGDPLKKTTQKVACYRCGRDGHISPKCEYTTDIHGNKLDVKSSFADKVKHETQATSHHI